MGQEISGLARPHIDALTKPHVDAAVRQILDETLPYLILLVIGVFACAFSLLGLLYGRPSTHTSKEVTKKRKPTYPPLRAADHLDDGKHHLLLCATGSVATIKIPNILEKLSHHTNLSIRVVFSNSALEFLQSQSDEQPSITSLGAIKNVDGIYVNEDEWTKPWVRKDNILHIELRRWADLMAIVPLSANSLAKLALGLSDDLISSVARAWDTSGTIDLPRPEVRYPYGEGARKGMIVAPSMNTAMWEHPVTTRHLSLLEKDWGVQNDGWVEVLRPQEKTLACGDTGSGAMKDWREIVGVLEMRFGMLDNTARTPSEMT